MIDSIIGPAFTILCFAVFVGYWGWRFERKFRKRAAECEQETVADRDRFEAARTEWEKQNAASRAQSAQVVAAAEAVLVRANQFWIKRGMEPTPPPEPEPSESSS